MARGGRPGVPRLWSSFASKLLITLVIFGFVPGLVYSLFSRADAERNALLLRIVQDQGRVVAEAVFPFLEDFSPTTAAKLRDLLPRLGTRGTTIKILFRPVESIDPAGFFFVASVPAVRGVDLDTERKEIIRTGLLSEFKETCAGEKSLAFRFTNAAGGPEVLTHLGSRVASNGCWVVLTSVARSDILNASVDRPYWQTPQLRIAAIIYLLMAVLILSIFADAWRNLRRFRDAAQAIRAGSGKGVSFVSRNRIPELSAVAEDFDELVTALKQSESLIRQAAEENAHAFKGPLAVISQALEPIRRALPSESERAHRGLAMIEQSVTKLDALISASRRLDEATAETIARPLQRIDISPLLGNLTSAYVSIADHQGIILERRIAKDLWILGDSELLETAAENLVENAFGFAPSGSRVTLTAMVVDKRVAIVVSDQGPGVPDEDLDRIFSRYFSTRDSADGGTSNFGIGLWIVRRNVEFMGGSVKAANNPQGGLHVLIELPLSI